MSKPRRSALFIPADNPRALQKIGPELAADCIIIDLEDAVSNENKACARNTLKTSLSTLDTADREVLLRINASGSAAYADDLRTAASLPIQGVVLPKVEHPQQVTDLARALPQGMDVWVMLETARGILNAAAICSAHPALSALLIGTQDLAMDLRLAPGSDNNEIIQHSLMQCLLAARAANLDAIDSVCPEFKDLSALQQQCQRAKNRGFDGKAAIHPAQLDTINTLFSPSVEQLDNALHIVAAWELAAQQGKSVASINGRMVEHLHAIQARQLLARAEAIEKMQRH